MAGLSAPARRALEGAGISTVKQLARHTAQQVMALHGMGPSSLPKLEAVLKAEKLSFQRTPPRTMVKSAGKAHPAIDAYLGELPEAQRKVLETLRKRIIAAAPGIEEHFAYGFPAFKYNGHPMLYVGASKHHCGLYGSVPAGFKERLMDYEVSKGAIRFTPTDPLPAELVKDLVKAKMAEIELRWPVKPKKGPVRKTAPKK